MGEQFTDPNREAVGLSPAWVEGDGGGGSEPPPAPAATEAEPEPETEAEPEGEPNGEEEDEARAGPDLDAMTRDELLAHARSLGVKPANAAMTKDDLRAGIERHGRP